MSMKRKALFGSVAVLSLAASLVACSGGTAEEPAPDTTVQEGNPEAVAAAEIVAAHSAAYDEFTAPGPAIAGVDQLSGEVVYYVAANMQAAVFLHISEALEEAFSEADIELRTCDAKANPEGLATCLGQAVDANAGAVIVAALPQEMASTAFQNVADAGIPLLNLKLQPDGEGDPTMVGYLSGNNVEQQSWLTNWVIADSNAEANVLIVKATDSPAPIAWIEQGAIKVYDEGCSACEYQVVEVNTGQLDKVPSLVSAALVANPDIEYVHLPFAVTLQPAIQGVQSAGRDDIKIVSLDTPLDAMKNLADGRLIGALAGEDPQALSWYAADEVLRMMVGESSVRGVEFPFRRIFTAENVGTLELTPGAEATGEWFGDADFRGGFLKLWGLAS